MWRSGAGWVRLSKSEKNIGAGGWRVDNYFEAVDSADVLAHPHITTQLTSASDSVTIVYHISCYSSKEPEHITVSDILLVSLHSFLMLFFVSLGY